MNTVCSLTACRSWWRQLRGEAQQLAVTGTWRMNRNWEVLVKRREVSKQVINSPKRSNFNALYYCYTRKSNSISDVPQDLSTQTAATTKMEAPERSEESLITGTEDMPTKHPEIQMCLETPGVWECCPPLAPRAGAWVFVNVFHAVPTCLWYQKDLEFSQITL